MHWVVFQNRYGKCWWTIVGYSFLYYFVSLLPMHFLLCVVVFLNNKICNICCCCSPEPCKVERKIPSWSKCCPIRIRLEVQPGTLPTVSLQANFGCRVSDRHFWWCMFFLLFKGGDEKNRRGTLLKGSESNVSQYRKNILKNASHVSKGTPLCCRYSTRWIS